jgi:hypothetical protein
MIFLNLASTFLKSYIFTSKVSVSTLFDKPSNVNVNNNQTHLLEILFLPAAVGMDCDTVLVEPAVEVASP